MWTTRETPSASCWKLPPKVNRSTSRTHAPRPFFRNGPPLTPLHRAPDPNKQLAENIRRVFAERGHDFFEKRDAASGRIDIGDSDELDDRHEETSAETANPSTQPMTPEQLLKMWSDIIPRLECVSGHPCTTLIFSFCFPALLLEK